MDFVGFVASGMSFVVFCMCFVGFAVFVGFSSFPGARTFLLKALRRVRGMRFPSFCLYFVGFVVLWLIFVVFCMCFGGFAVFVVFSKFSGAPIYSSDSIGEYL